MQIIILIRVGVHGAQVLELHIWWPVGLLAKGQVTIHSFWYFTLTFFVSLEVFFMYFHSPKLRKTHMHMQYKTAQLS